MIYPRYRRMIEHQPERTETTEGRLTLNELYVEFFH
jgi:hypothetical protein